jgi:hypothetical protein
MRGTGFRARNGAKNDDQILCLLILRIFSGCADGLSYKDFGTGIHEVLSKNALVASEDALRRPSDLNHAYPDEKALLILVFGVVHKEERLDPGAHLFLWREVHLGIASRTAESYVPCP